MHESNNDQSLCHEMPTEPQPNIGTVLVAGATGYVGGRLVPELIERGYHVRVMIRVASTEDENRWPQTEVVVADALNRAEVDQALEGVDTVYYLIHSMLLGLKDFEDVDLQAAINFRESAQACGVKRIIYLSSLGDSSESLSSHLSSRMRVAAELEKGTVPTTILRAAIIIGSGSASYEMINYLIRRVPIFPVPRWATTRCQPISIRDVVRYLVGALEQPETAGKTLDIGGADILTYKEMLQTHAEILRKKRLFFRSPISNIKFYSYITSFVTPVPASICWCLMEGVKSDVICQSNEIESLLPLRKSSYKESLVGAISREEQDAVYTRWSDNYPPDYELAIKLSELEGSPEYTCSYSLVTDQTSENLFRSITHIGGKRGWFNSTFLWRVRGWVDRVLMGVGTSRGRRSAANLRVNDVVDFWRVERIKPNQQLLLRAELKTPGKAWLELRVDSIDGSKNRLSVHAYYYTKGFWGRAYWYVFLPFHQFIFVNLIQQIEKSSRRDP